MLTDKELEEIRRKMLELEEEPPAGSWQHIQAEVKPKPIWRRLWWLLPLLLILMTGIITYQLQDEPVTPPTARVDDDMVKQEQSAAATPLAAGGGLNKPEKQTPETSQSAPVQQSLSVSPEPAAVVSAAPTIKGKYRTPATQPVVRQPAKATGVVILADSTASVPHQVISRSVLPEGVSLSRKTNSNEAEAGTTEAREVKEGTAEAGAAEDTEIASGEVAESTKAEAFKDKSLIDSVAVDAEKNTKPAPKKTKVPGSNEWTAGVYFAPRYAFRKFVPNTSDNILITEVNSANQLDPECMGFEFGTSFSRKLASGLYLEGGLSWMQLKENVAYTLTTGKIDSFNVSQAGNGQVVVEPMYSMEKRQLISSYAYGGLRLGATYYFLESGTRRLNITMAGGANLLIKGITKQYSNGEWRETVEFPSAENILEQSNYNLLLGVGYNVSVLDNYEVTLMPTMNYFLGSTFKEREPLGLKPYSLGLNFQLKRRFNR